MIHALDPPRSMMSPAYVDKLAWIKRSIPDALREVVTLQILLDTPFLPWKDEYMGGTEYIDRIDDLPSSIMMGEDTFGRSFLSIKTCLRHRPHETQVTTLFQRYSDDRNTWTYGSRHMPCWMYGMMYFCQKGWHISRFSTVMKELLDDQHIFFILKK
jgi:hypothetical protein